MHQLRASIDFSLLERLTDELVCTRCFQAGILTPVTQVVSKHHRPKTLCQDCAPHVPRPLAKVIPLDS